MPSQSRPVITTSRQIVATGTALMADRMTNGILYNPSGGTVTVGDSTVTTSNGLDVPDGAALEFALASGESLYANAGSSLTVQVIIGQG